MLTIENNVVTADKVNVLFESLYISKSAKDMFIPYASDDVISMSKVNIHIKGFVNITKNHARLSVINFKSCNISFSGTIIFDTNYCGQVISLDTHIKVMEHTNITFVNNRYHNKLIAVEYTDEYNQPYPFCLFQYNYGNE